VQGAATPAATTDKRDLYLADGHRARGLGRSFLCDHAGGKEALEHASHSKRDDPHPIGLQEHLNRLHALFLARQNVARELKNLSNICPDLRIGLIVARKA